MRNPIVATMVLLVLSAVGYFAVLPTIEYVYPNLARDKPVLFITSASITFILYVVVMLVLAVVIHEKHKTHRR